MSVGRVVIIPFLHGKLAADGSLVEPDIEAIMEQWVERHPQFRDAARGFRVARSEMHLEGEIPTELVRVTADFSPDLASYDPTQDVDLYEAFLAQDDDEQAGVLHKIWVEQCEAAEQIEGAFGTQKALDYLVGEKFLNYLEAADASAEFRAEIPDFVAEIKRIFERWQLAQYLEVARDSEPFDPRLFADDDEFEPDEVEEMRRDDIRQCTRDLLLVERARDWLLE